MSAPRALVLAAGKSVRIKSATPKVLHPLSGRPVLAWVLAALAEAGIDDVHLVVGPDQKEAISKRFPDAGIHLQAEPMGTGHAVQCARAAFEGFQGPLLILPGDAPLVRGEALRAMLEACAEAPGAVLTAIADDPEGYGRVVRDRQGAVARIVEHKDAGEDQRLIEEINSGMYALRATDLAAIIDHLGNANAQGECYLTDIVSAMAKKGRAFRPVVAEDESEVWGINDREQLAMAESVLQERIHEHHMARGVTITAPWLTYIEADVEIGADTTILPFSVIRAGARIGAHCEVGPCAHVRPGTVLDDHAELGNFVEAKNARVGSGSKAKHLTYLGDVTIGERVNIGAGTVICNYDGVKKHHTVIEDGVFVGSGSMVVAPRRIGRKAKTGAGSVVTHDVAPETVVVGVPARPLARKPAPGGGDAKAPS